LNAAVNMSAAEWIVRFLEARGTHTVFGIPGGAVLPLYHALAASSLGHVLARHEQAAGFMAAGQARLSGRAGVFVVSSGPGATNAVTALADAFMDSIPLVCIAGQVPTGVIGTQAFQEVATVEMARPVTKASLFAGSVDDLVRLLPEAFSLAESGRRGPVLIDVPKDVQNQRVPASTLLALSSAPLSCEGEGAVGSEDAWQADDATWQRANAYDEIAMRIRNARRPVLYLGGGVLHAGAADRARALAERADLPTTTTLMALGVLPPGHPLYLGMLGMHGARATNQAIAECDLLVAIGARFDDRATGRTADFAPDAAVVHVDIDARELGKIRTPQVAVRDDAGRALAALSARLEPQARPHWRARIDALRAECGLVQAARDDARSPYGVLHAIADAGPAGMLVATDVGQHQMWVAQAYPFQAAGCWLTSGGLGTMGFGLPTAIGAALARPDVPVLCVSGDGSLMMNVQELATLAELDANVKVLVYDNGGLGLVRQQQALFYGERYSSSRFTRAADLCAVARAFGVPAWDIGEADAIGGEAEVRRRLRAEFARPGPALIRLPVHADAQVLPMVPPGAANTETLDVVSA
jgi:acetolactate synthase-1/2/3 large subunit